MAHLNQRQGVVDYPGRMVATEQAAADRRLTEDVALVDRSGRGKLALSGPEARAFLSGQVTNDVESLVPGTGCYAALLTNKGKMLGDLRVIDVGPPTPELWLDTERIALQTLFDTIRRATVGWQTELHKRTLEQALLSLVGPHAADAVGGDLAPEHANRHAELGGARVLLIATDVGVDVVCPRRPPRSCAWRPVAPATASTSTSRPSRRRPTSTSAR
jgi:tRNA-modifying protein YgfZ